METIEVNDWDEFSDLLKSLDVSQEPSSDEDLGHVSELLFRGQANAKWHLDTTLERWGGHNMMLRAYYGCISRVHPEIESRTGRNWEIPTDGEYAKATIPEWGLRYSQSFIGNQLYEYLVYLRHHGFPSPLLDWTRSPYVAAYFAFRNAKPDGSVAIFAFREYAGNCKEIPNERPILRVLGKYVRSHERHFLQQSDYTVCFKKVSDYDYQYRQHEEVFSNGNGMENLLWKFVFPGTLRKEVLQYLQLHNINGASLFGLTEDILMESLAIREFVL